MPSFEVKNEPLEIALRKLNAETQDIAARSGGRMPPLQFTHRGTPERRVSAELRRVSLDHTIRLLALQAGMEAASKGDTVELTPFPDDPVVATREFAVPPTFAADLPSLLGAPQGSATGNSSPASVPRTLRRHGILKGSNAGASCDPGRSRLRVTSTGNDLRRVEGLVDLLVGTSPVMLKFAIRQLSFARDPGLPTGIHPASETKRWLKKATRSGGTATQSLPSVTTRPGQQGTLEVIRELPRHKQWLGTKLAVEGDLYGQGAQVQLDYEHRVLTREGLELTTGDWMGRGSPPHQDLFSETVRSYSSRKGPVPILTRKASTRAVLQDGSLVIQKTTGTSKVTDYVLVEVSVIDATGRPISKR